MTALDIICRRTNLSESDAEFYAILAETRIRSYLRLSDTASIDNYVLSVSDIAILLWQLDTASKTVSGSLGYSSESYSEGSVSVSHSVSSGSDLSSTYEAQINEILKALDSDRLSDTVVFY